MTKPAPRDDQSVGTTITLTRRSMNIVLGVAVVVVGAFMLGTRRGGPEAPASPATTSFAPVAAPIMSQVAPVGIAVPQGDATAAAIGPFTGGARLAADYARLDFGQLAFGETVDAQFTVTNVGDAPLVVEETVRVQTVVGC